MMMFDRSIVAERKEVQKSLKKYLGNPIASSDNVESGQKLFNRVL